MAELAHGSSRSLSSAFVRDLADPARTIKSPRFDMLLLWGVPLIALSGVDLWLGWSATLGGAAAERGALALVLFSSIITYAHLVAVVPRAYFNPDVFAQNRARLIFVPILLLAALLISPLVLAIAGVVAIFWDVHHSAMQNFGLARIYDLKAGNDPQGLRQTDLRLHWMLYVGPLVGGASLMTHLHAFDKLDATALSALARLPGVLEGETGPIAAVAIGAWAVAIGMAVYDYRAAMAKGYRMPAHKLALTMTTGLVSILAWGFSSPIVALCAINIYHAIQYFALVWVKEGARMSGLTGDRPRAALMAFLGGCGLLGFAYQAASQSDAKWLIAPFLACSLLHFWYDSFVWSVRKRQV